MNVISYAFFRSPASEYERQDVPTASRGNFFRHYIRAIVRAHHSVFPEWQMWFHHDGAVKEFPEFALLEKYQAAGLIKLFDCGIVVGLTSAMLWRMKPAWIDGVDRFLCRDIDSLPQPRERKAVQRWIESDKPISALHDSTSHWGTVILGGMCGFKAEYVRGRFATESQMRDSMRESGIDFNRKGGDQHFLNRVFPESDCLDEWVDPDGPWDQDMNFVEGWARCVGGAFPGADHVAKWYDRHEYTDVRILVAELWT